MRCILAVVDARAWWFCAGNKKIPKREKAPGDLPSPLVRTGC